MLTNYTMKPWTRASLQDAHYIYMDSLQAFKCISTCTCTRSSPTGAPSGDRSRDGILQRYGPLRAHRPRHTAGVLPPRGPQSSRPSLPSRSRDHHGEPPRQRVPLARLFPAICNGNRKGLQAPLPNQARPPTMADIAGLKELETELSLLREKRIERAKLCLEVLSSTYGLDLSWDEFCTLNRINQKTSTADGTIGRPHIANYLIHKGYCTTVRESFDKYLAKEPIESLKKEMLPLRYAITRAIQLGGVPVLAHACLKYDWDATVKVLEEAVQSGMKHLEVYHPSHTQKNILHLKQYCDRHGLTASMGSDFHGDSPQYSSRIPPGGYEDARHPIDPAEKKKLVRSLFKQSS